MVNGLVVVGAPRTAAHGCTMGSGVCHGEEGHRGGGGVAMAESCSRGCRPRVGDGLGNTVEGEGPRLWVVIVMAKMGD